MQTRAALFLDCSNDSLWIKRLEGESRCVSMVVENDVRAEYYLGRIHNGCAVNPCCEVTQH